MANYTMTTKVFIPANLILRRGAINAKTEIVSRPLSTSGISCHRVHIAVVGKDSLYRVLNMTALG